ncbi:MAG: Gfo/Idh/MocA family oxidoreductase [Polyangiaceae bacterium]
MMRSFTPKTTSELELPPAPIADFRSGRPNWRPRVGIMGVGGVTRYAHMPHYRRFGVEVVALFDNDAAKLAAAVAALPSPPAVATNDLGEFLRAAPALDLVDIATPSETHYAVTRPLVDVVERTALLVQKPLATTVDDARSLVAAAEKKDITLAVNVNARWVATFAKLRELVAQGSVGPPFFISIVNRGLNVKRPDEWRAGLGRLIIAEMAVHYLDWLVWTFGRPSRVYGRTRTIPGAGVRGDNLAVVTFDWTSGLLGSMTQDWCCVDTSAWTYHPAGEAILIEGPEGAIQATPRELRLTRHDEATIWKTSESWFPDAFAGPIAETLAHAHGGKALSISGRQHIDVLELVDAVYASARSGESVVL